MAIELPGELQTGNACTDGNVCIKTKDWDFGTDDVIHNSMWYANRMKGDETLYYLTLYLTNAEEAAGKIQCDGSFCSSLCGSNSCTLN